MAINMTESSTYDTNTKADRTGHSQEVEEEAATVPPPKYVLDEDADPSELEDLCSYGPGGYHPVALGDMLGGDGRFRVVHKLGFGGYATVWLCRDGRSNKWRAVKIMAAKASKPDCADLRALELFDDVERDVLAANHIQLPLEHFWIDGPNGRHLCFVLPFLGPKLSHLNQRYAHLAGLMKDICFQLVEALEFIHSRRLCHGDFRTDDILLRLADGVDEWDEEAVMELLGEPILAAVRHTDGPDSEREPGVPAYLVERTEVIYGSGACSSRVAVIDFGVSYQVSQPPVDRGTGIPMPFAALEQLLELDTLLGFGTDTWSLGVTIAKVRCGFTPFADEYDELLGGLEKMECIIGPMPNPYRAVWRDWGGEFVNCQDQEGGFLDGDGDGDDNGSWEDETVFATVHAKEEEYTRNARVGEGRAPNYLHYRMQRGLMMRVDNQMAADMTAQAASNPDGLPTYPYGEKAPAIEYAQMLEHPMTESGICLVYDLLLKMFQWHPEQRATLDQIASHEWFGDRPRRQPGPPSELRPRPPAANKKRARARSPLNSSGKKPRCDGEGEANGQDDSPAAAAGREDGMGGLGGPAASYSYVARIMTGLRNGAGWMTKKLAWCIGTTGKVLLGILTCLRLRPWRLSRRPTN